MKDKIVRKIVTLLCPMMVAPFLQADTIEKSAIKANGQLVYKSQKNVEKFSEMFSEADTFGRLRNNNFYFVYTREDGSHDTHFISGLGASLLYRSAFYKGFDFNVGFHATKAFFNAHADEIDALKPGKDTVSRFDYVNSGSTYMTVMDQVNLAYKLSKTELRVGRQIVETFYTKSNDTKMIPNTFDGFVLTTKDIPSTELKVAYLVEQKLRDHTSSHSVLMYGDANSSSEIKPQWSENDDGAMHRGLTYTALSQASKPTASPLIVLDVQNNSIKNLKINFSSYIVPELLSQAMLELNYKITFSGFSITPGVRYLEQFDNGAGAVGGASLYKIGLSGYRDAKSLDSSMIAARIVTKFDDYKLNLAYTNILDRADLVTPWRAFPTSGYTRSMGMYNWRANVKSYRLELVKGANKSGVYKSPFIQTSILYMDGDQTKSETDSMFYYAGLVQNIPSLPELQYRVRLGWRDFLGNSVPVSDYLDSRLEFNYLF